MRRIIAMFFVLLLVSTNVGLALGTHFCGGHSLETKLLTSHDDLTCGMEFVKKGCDSMPSHSVIKKSDCCSNEVQSFQIDEEFAQVATPPVPAIHAVILIAIIIPEFLPETTLSTCTPPYLSPPWQPQNAQTAFQSFLI